MLIGLSVALRWSCPRESQPWSPTRLWPGIFRRRPGRIRRRFPAFQRSSLTPDGPARQTRPQACWPHSPRPSVGRLNGCSLGLWLLSLLGQVTSTTCVLTGPSQSALNPGSPNHVQAYGQLAARLAPARKHSFRRAQLRALRDGVTVYRGRTHDAASLSLRRLGHAPSGIGRFPTPMANPNLLKVVTWNCGGLHASRFAELTEWLNSQEADPAHILLVQECHWPHSAEFHNDKWVYVYSGSGTSQGGVMVLVSRRIAGPQQVRFAELQPGRALHTRVALEPPLDILCVYQHAWSNVGSGDVGGPSRAELHEDLLSKRQCIWQTISRWTRSIPKRNTVLIGGDMNASLQEALPHVGAGVHPHKYPHADQPDFQRLVVSLGLVALNTWGRAGKPAGTFLHAQHSVQLDYLFTRLPCHQQSRRTTVMRTAPIVHPTGMRHVPVCGYIPKPTVPCTQKPQHVRPQDVSHALRQQPALAAQFQHTVSQLLATEDTEDLDTCLHKAWQQCRAQPKAKSRQPPCTAEVSLRSFWAAKQHLRTCQATTAQYLAPLVWHVVEASASNILRAQPRMVLKLRPLFQLWRALTTFRRQDKQLRSRVKQRKQQQVDDLVTEAQALDGKGLSALQILVKRIRPRAPRRSIHFRTPDGHLMSEQDEMACLRTYFRDLFQDEDCLPPQHSLLVPIVVDRWEVDEALRSLPPRKALPPGHAPAALWKLAAPQIGPSLTATFGKYLKAGPMHFPPKWHDSHLALLAKPGKQPNCPANLRPINLLPAEAKILARIAAKRLRPLITQAAQSVPQFAYIPARQCADAIDRVMSHCMRVREALQGQHRNAWRTGSRASSYKVIGGLQLSLDLTKAYDRLPRRLLRTALERVGADEELITLVLYIHDQARIIISRHQQSVSVGMGRGVRQGCGLSPLLWIAFTLLIHHKLSEYIPADAQTSYADDFHVHWEFDTEQECRQACQMIPRIIDDLKSFGMDVSLGKTVALLAIKGSKAASMLKTFTAKVRGERVLSVRTPSSTVTLPLRRTHDYLGVKIGYHLFERSTMQHRLQLSWTAMHRLQDLLQHKLVPLHKRVLLWKSCVWSVAAYGITAVGLDRLSAQKFHAGILRQLRLVARSPAHVSHETNAQLLVRLKVKDPLIWMQEHCAQRVSQCRLSLGSLQPSRVHQWWSVLLMSFSLHHDQPSQPGVLTEVTQIIRVRSHCQICGQSFPSKHALKVHIGKQHPDAQPRHEPNPTIKNRRLDVYRKFAKGGLPQCRFCLKKFYGWPQFMGHFSQNACPMWSGPDNTSQHDTRVPPDGRSAAPSGQVQQFSQPAALVELGASAPTADKEVTVALAEPDPVPLFHRPDIQDLAQQGDVRKLCRVIRDSQTLNHCPECFQKVTRPAYLSRHAVKMHPAIRDLQPDVEAWAQKRSGLLKPCQWCGEANFSRPSLHLKACPVLWMIGHLLGRHATLRDLGQRVLYDRDGGRTAGGSQGVRPVWGLHEAASSPPAASSGSSLPGLHHDGQRDPDAGPCTESGHGGRPREKACSAIDGASGDPAKMGQGRGQGRQGGPQHKGSLHRKRPGRRDSTGANSGDEPADCAQGGAQWSHDGKLGQAGHPEQPSSARLATTGRLSAMACAPTGSRRRTGRAVRDPGGQRAQGAQRGCESHGEIVSPHGGCIGSDTLGYGIYPIPPNGGDRQRVRDHATAVRHSCGMEPDEARTADLPHQSDAENPPPQPLQCLADEAGSPGGGSGLDGQSASQGSDRGINVCVSAMGSLDPPAHQGGGAAIGV